MGIVNTFHDGAGSLTRHGSLGNDSTHDLPIRPHGDGRASEHVAHHDAVGAHG
jgi:hypothetical protein